MSEKIIKTIMWSSTFVGAAVSTQPYAALAWAGVSIILPLILNHSKESCAMVEGLETITKSMQLFRIREVLYLHDAKSPSQPDFESAVVELYSIIFEYEARVITHLSNSTIKRGLSGTFGLSDWNTMITKVHAANQRCEAFASLFDRSREAKQLASIEATNAIQEKILISFQSFQEELQRNRQDDQEMRLLQTLTSDYRTDKDFISKRIDGTCEWLFNNEIFTEWRDCKMSNLLWVSSGPGCGKSVLSKALVDERFVTNSILCSTICYFFFKAGQQKRMLATDALSAILHQLFQNTELIRHGLANYKNHGTDLTRRFSDLWETLVKCVEDPEAGEIVCVIDALDECEKESRDFLLQEIMGYLSLDARRRLGSRLKFLVTSRSYKDIEDQFEQLSRHGSYFHLDIDDNSAELGRDINLVIDAQVKNFARNFDGDEQLRIADHLKSRENRTYLWLFLTIDIIEESSIKYSKSSTIHSLLKGLPNKVSDACEKILRRSDDPETAKKLLQIIVAATRPLSLQEANIALTIAMHEQLNLSHGELELWPSRGFSSIVKNLCGLMVAIHDDKLSLLHQTVSEFLSARVPAESSISMQQSSASKGSANETSALRTWEGCIDISCAHGLMSQICLIYLTLPDFALLLETIIKMDNHDDKESRESSVDTPHEIPRWTTARSSEKTDSKYLRLFEDCERTSLSLHDILKKILTNYPFPDYSASNWAHHYRQQDQQYQYILKSNAELMCDPSSISHFYWVSRFDNPHKLNAFNGFDRLGIASYFGLVDLVEGFSNQAQDINAKQFSYKYIYSNKHPGHTALSIGIRQGFPDVVQLLERGANSSLQDNYGRSPLREAVGLDPDVPLSDRLAIVQLILDSGVDINSVIPQGKKPISYMFLNSSKVVIGPVQNIWKMHRFWGRAPIGFSQF